MSNYIPNVGDMFILHCVAKPSPDGQGVVTEVTSMEPVAKEKPKSETEKLQDLLRDVGNDAFCKIMSETIEKHNELHQQVIQELDKMSLRFYSLSAPFQLNNICELKKFIAKQLDK